MKAAFPYIAFADRLIKGFLKIIFGTVGALDIYEGHPNVLLLLCNSFVRVN
jgi:hypothetical protein